MLKEIILAAVQALTEFLPVSSDGHLAIVSNIIGSVDLFFITFLHLASLLAVIIFTRKEIFDILKFNKDSWRIIKYIVIGITPAIIFGFFFNDIIEQTLSSFLLISIFFLFNGIVVLSTKFTKAFGKELNNKNTFAIGLMQALALLPGISRSGMTISTGLFFGIDRKKAFKFSFLMFVPLSIGAFVLELIKYPNSINNLPVLTLVFSFIVCFILSLLSLNLLNYIINSDKFWVFGIYCFLIAVFSFLLFVF